MSATESFQLTENDRQHIAEDGFLVREGVFSAAECEQMAADCDALAEKLLKEKEAERMQFGNYLIERRDDVGTIVKWEPGGDLLQGIEPFVHLSNALNEWSQDPRLIEACKGFLGEGNVTLFTEKINFKRAHKGDKYILHQDYPYWVNLAKDPGRVVTAMIYLDDSSIENGCLQVAPGSHKDGLAPCWEGEIGRDREIDTNKFDENRLIPLEVKKGTVAFFGSLLVHRSAPNTSNKDRRALLYSYQPAGFPHALEVRRQMLAQQKSDEEFA